MDVLWPDFTRSDLDAAIEEFKSSFPPVWRTVKPKTSCTRCRDRTARRLCRSQT